MSEKTSAPVPSQWKVQTAVYGAPLTLRATAVITYLLWRAGPKGFAFPSVRLIAADTKVSRREVYRVLAALQEAKVIERKPSERGRATYTTVIHKNRLKWICENVRCAAEVLRCCPGTVPGQAPGVPG